MTGKVIAGLVLAGAVGLWALQHTAYNRGKAAATDSALVNRAAVLADSLKALQAATAKATAKATADSLAALRSAGIARTARLASEALRDAVRAITPTTVLVHDTVATVPREVTERFAADSVALATEQAAHEATRGQVASLRSVIAALGAEASIATERLAVSERRILSVGAAQYAKGKQRGRLETGVLGGLVLLLVVTR